MFNPLTRTLKLGLTAITILTAGGFAFAPTAAEALGTDAQIANCNANPFGTGPAFGEGGCNVTLLLDSERWSAAKERHCARGNNRMTRYCNNPTSVRWNAAKEEYCNRGNNRSLPICRPTAVRWRADNPTVPTTPYTANRHDQFLQGTPTGVNEGTDTTVTHRGSLNLSTAKFGSGAGEALDGSATDGVSYFTGYVINRSDKYYYGYAGIFSGTDLGAPIAETSGTAKWVGKFSGYSHLLGVNPPSLVVRDFILEVDYATKSLDAFVHFRTASPGKSSAFYQLDGHYDSSGIITGEIELSLYDNSDRTSRTFFGRRSSVTGLIGKEGAVGAFHSGYTDSSYPYSNPFVYAGGFVARPAGVVTGAVAYLETTCEADPFHYLCFTSNQRATRILADCRGERTSTSPVHCTVATVACVNDPFGTDCHKTLGGYALNIAQTNRFNFCNITTNSRNSLCTGANLTNLCNYAPFSPLCVDNDNYASKREDTFESCKNRDSDILSCNGVRQAQAPSGKADAATWADGLITLEKPKGISSITSVDLSYDPYRGNPYRKSQFVEGLEVLEEGFNLRTRGKTPFTFLTLGDNLVGSSTETLGGEFEDGVGFFGLKVGYGVFPFHAGILSGTDLGAPITRTSEAKAIWSGVFQAIGGKGRATHRNFDLTINFIADNAGGTIDAFVQNTGDKYYHLSGNFDSIGVITGRVDYGPFDSSKNPTGDSLPGRLAGLIGEQGAVGAFIADMDDYGRGFYAGGFVARETTVNYADWEASANPLDAIGTSTVNQFLAGGTDTLLDTTTRSTVLNLADATHNRIGLGGDSTDGVAFFKNPEIGFNALYYAGVLSGTDLGLPIEPGASGDWKGSIRIVYGSGIWNAVDFNLTVTLGGTADDVNQAGIITAEAENILIDNGQKSLHINGKFNYKGVIIKGTVDLGGGGYATGILTGLIGQEGAVGAFISNGSSPFSGGFVARPDLVQVTSANLATLQTKPRDITNSGFLTASSAGLDIENSSLPQGHALSGQQMILRRGGADSDNPDGIAYFFTTADSGNTSLSYGGILSTTNLGAPVEATQTSAIWNGYHSYRDSSNIVNERTKFYVDFAAGKFGFANDDENGIGTFVKAPFGTTPVVTFALNGLFGSQNNMAVGQLGGTLKYVFKPNSGTAATDTDGFTRYNLNVHGLIGQEGAVGVYLEESVNASRVGGFVASAQ